MESGVLHPLERVSFTSFREMTIINNDKGNLELRACKWLRFGATRKHGVVDLERPDTFPDNFLQQNPRGHKNKQGQVLQFLTRPAIHQIFGLPTPPTQPMLECYFAIFAADGPLVKRAREDPAVSGVANERLAQAIDCIGRSVALRLRQRRCEDWTRHDCVHCKMLRTLAGCQGGLADELASRDARARGAAAADAQRGLSEAVVAELQELVAAAGGRLHAGTGVDRLYQKFPSAKAELAATGKLRGLAESSGGRLKFVPGEFGGAGAIVEGGEQPQPEPQRRGPLSEAIVAELRELVAAAGGRLHAGQGLDRLYQKFPSAKAQLAATGKLRGLAESSGGRLQFVPGEFGGAGAIVEGDEQPQLEPQSFTSSSGEDEEVMDSWDCSEEEVMDSWDCSEEDGVADDEQEKHIVYDNAQSVTIFKTSTSTVWSHQSVFGDSLLECSDDSLRRANISSDKVKMQNLNLDQMAVAKKTLHPELLPCLRSSFVETRPHALEFLDEPALLSVALEKPYDNADELWVLHKSKPDAAWEVLNEEVQLSEGGKRASIRIRSFCTRVIVDEAALPQQALAIELARARPQRPSLDHVEPDPVVKSLEAQPPPESQSEPQPNPASINEWLSKLKLQQYESVLVEEGYDELQFLRDADTCDIEELLERLVNEKVMKKAHSKTFMKAWDKLNDLELQSAAKTTCSNPFFSAFAPPEIMPNGPSHGWPVEVAMFAWEHSQEVAADAETREMTRASPNRKGPAPIAHGSLVSVVLDLPEDAFDTDHGATELLQWDGTYSIFQFEVTCLRGAELRKHVCKAIISVAEQRVATLQFELNVVQRVLPSPPVSPLSEVQTQELTVLSRNWRVLQMLSNSSSGSGSGSIRSKDILRSLNRERNIMSGLWAGDQGRLPSQLQNLIPKLMTSYELFVADLREMNLNQSKETHICHLSGHGEARSLVFQGDTERHDENLQEPKAMAFASEVVDNGVRCLVLNCCDSGDLGRAVNRCARKKGKRVVVVCWDSPVVSRACEEVTDTFYRSILQPLTSTQEGAAAVDDIFVAAEKAFQAVERKHHAGCLGKHLRDRVDDPQNRFAIARCDHEGLWRYSVDSDGQWDWEPIERRGQADDGMEDFPLPDQYQVQPERREDANPPSDPYLHYARCLTPTPEPGRALTKPHKASVEDDTKLDGSIHLDEKIDALEDAIAAVELAHAKERAPTEPCMETDQDLDDSSNVAKVQAARENRLDRLAPSQPAIEAGGAPVLTPDVALQTFAPGVPDDCDEAPDFDDDL